MPLRDATMLEQTATDKGRGMQEAQDATRSPIRHSCRLRTRCAAIPPVDTVVFGAEPAEHIPRHHGRLWHVGESLEWVFEGWRESLEFARRKEDAMVVDDVLVSGAVSMWSVVELSAEGRVVDALAAEDVGRRV
jgi:hypothetical protein